MPTLAEHQSGEFVKLFYIGNSGAGKTGSLASLIPDYDLRIIDMDNGLDALVNQAKQHWPDRLSSIQYETVRDKYKATPAGPQVVPPARALVKVSNLLDKWTDGSKPEEWGPSKILIIDSLTMLGKAAFEWARAMNPNYRDSQLWYKGGQDVLDNIIATITSDIFHTNVIVISHIDYRERDGVERGFINALGKALGPRLPLYVNTMLLAESSGSGTMVKRKIKTLPTSLIDLKNPAPMRIDATYDLETGMAQIFKKLKE